VFIMFFKDNSMVLERENWTKEVQKALTIPPSSKGVAKKRRMEQTCAFNLLCRKASKWIQYLPEIQKLENQLDKFEFRDEDKYEDEDEDEMQEKQQRLKQNLKQMQREKKCLFKKARR